MDTKRSRHLAAVWFADIAGYVQLSSKDEEAGVLAVQELRRLAATAADAHEGQVVKHVADAVLSTFPSAPAALDAALDLLADFSNSELIRPHSLDLRIGVHVGEVVEGDDGDLFGEAVHIASRLEAVADPGQIVLTESVRAQIGGRDGYVVTPIGERRLRGLEDPMTVYAVDRVGDGAASADRCGECGRALDPSAAFCPSCGSNTPSALGDSSGEAEGGDPNEPEAEFLDRLRASLGDGFELGELLGRGGFAYVFSARDLRLKRDLAIKVLRAQLARVPDLVKRFFREGQAVARLRHPHIIPIFGVEESEGLVYLVMPAIEGQTLKQRIADEPVLDPEEAVRILVETAEGLQAAHDEGIIHRDIKPSNIILEGDERRVLIGDFGIAKALEGETATITGTNVALGTPHFMSPEQAGDAGEVDHRADIYSLGVIGFRLLSGRLPFEGSSSRSVIVQHVAMPPPDLSTLAPEVPRHVAEAVMKCLEKDPRDRSASCTDLIAAFRTEPERVEDAPPTPASAEERAAQRVAQLVEDRECLVFLGLHVPIDAADDPSRTAEHAIVEMLAANLEWDTDAGSLSEIAQQLELERGRDGMLAQLEVAVGESADYSRDVARRLAKTPFPVVVTTAYDTVLEDELDRVGRPYRRVVDRSSMPADGSAGDAVVRLFGSLDRPETIVVTEDDLWAFFDEFHTLADELKSLFATKSLVFIGHDPTEGSFRHLFAEISRFRAARSGGCYLARRWVPESAEMWAERKGIQLIRLDPAEFLARVERNISDGRSAPTREEASTVKLPGRPYKFLNYFEEDDSAIFFGRTREIAKCLSKIHAYPLNLLYAPSGTGKTSLINAGLIPQLRTADYLPVYARVYDDPEGEIVGAVSDAIGDAAVSLRTDLPLERFLPQAAGRAGQPLVIFLDQFEEIFIRYDAEYRRHFARTLQQCMNASSGRVRFVLSLREDFLARLSEFRQEIPSIFHNELRLAALTEEAAREAIVEPARLFGIDFEAALADRLLEDLFVGGIEPPQLQVVCDTLYDELSEGERVIRLSAYLELGETRQILGRYLEKVLLELPPDERRLTREVLKSLVTSEETKTVSSVEHVARLVGAPTDSVAALLKELSDRRLIRRVPREEGYWYELTHEYLVEEIQSWLSEKERELKRVRELLEQAVRNHSHLGILLPAAQVRVVREQEADLNLSKDEIQLLKASEAALENRKRRFWLSAAAIILFALIGGVTSRYVYLQSTVFVEAIDREYIEVQGFRESAETTRFESLVLWEGSPARWFLDRWLGFPRRVGQLGLDLMDLRPEARDIVKSGLALRASADLEAELSARLQPEKRVERLLLAGRPQEALALAANVFENAREIGEPAVDTMSWALGLAGVSDPTVAGSALANALRPSTDPFFAGLRGPETLVVPLLNNLAPGARRDLLESRTGMRPSVEARVVALAAKFDISGVLPRARELSRDSDETASSLGWDAVLALSPCSEAPDLLAYLGETGAQSPVGFSLTEEVIFFDRCPIPGVAAAFERRIRAEDDLFDLPILYRLEGAAALPRIERIAMNPPAGAGRYTPSRESVVASTLLRIPVREVLGVAQSSLSASNAINDGALGHLLAAWGDVEGVRLAARSIRRESMGFGNTDPLDALASYAGQGILQLIGDFLEESDSHGALVRRAAMAALRNKDLEQVLALVEPHLDDPSGDVRQAARTALVSARPLGELGPLNEAVDRLEGPQRLYVARAIRQRGGGPRPSTFREFLEIEAQVGSDLADVREAVLGLQEAYLGLPVDSALQALSSASRDVRHAAIIALADHPDRARARPELDRLALEERLPFSMAARQAIWTTEVVDRIHDELNIAERALEEGDRVTAQRIYADNPGFAFVRGFVGPRLGGIWKESQILRIQRPMQEIFAVIDGRRLPPDHVDELIGRTPLADRLPPGILDEAWNDQHAYRVTMGLSEPILIQDLELGPDS